MSRKFRQFFLPILLPAKLIFESFSLTLSPLQLNIIAPPLRRPNRKTQKQLDEEERQAKLEALRLRRARAQRWDWIYFWRSKKNMRQKLNKKGTCGIYSVLHFCFHILAVNGRKPAQTCAGNFLSFDFVLLTIFRIGEPMKDKNGKPIMEEVRIT